MNDTVTINKCCAICEHLWDKGNCPLYETYNAARALSVDAFDEWVKYRTCCGNFKLHRQFSTRTLDTIHKEPNINQVETKDYPDGIAQKFDA